ncbi:MAG: hypothetical protein RJQ21_13750 [Rhodospirillales bacterium]
MIEENSTLSDDFRNLARRIARAENAVASNMFPLTNGNFAYFPTGAIGRGFVLPPEKAGELLDEAREKQKKGIGQKTILGIVVLGFVGLKLLAFATSGSIAIIVVLLAISTVFVFGYFRRKRARMAADQEFSNFRQAGIKFKNEYLSFRTVALMKGRSKFEKITIYIIYIISIILISTVLVSIYLGDFFESPLPMAMTFMVGFTLAFLGRGVARNAKIRSRFRHLYGRNPEPDDLHPLDPDTGKMVPDPFQAQTQNQQVVG